MAKKINWVKIFDEYRVSYITEGGHVKTGNININCPFCASDDKHFMGVDVTSGLVRYGCWYSSEHRGTSAVRLLSAVLKINKNKALDILGLTVDYSDEDDYSDALSKLRKRINKKPEIEIIKELELYPEFKKIRPGDEYFNYLVDRKFHEDDIVDLCSQYNLKKCTHYNETDSKRNFYKRIILPFFLDGKIATWTGRSINKNSTLRYKDLSPDDSILSTKQLLFNYDQAAKGGKYLIVVEGQFDVLKLDFYGQDFGIRAVGLNTKNISENQIAQLHTININYDTIFVMLDTQKKTDVIQSIKIRDRLGMRNVKILPVPYGYKDTGAMPPGRVIAFCKNLLEEKK